MKALKTVLVVFAFSFTLLTLFSVSNVEAVEYLGDFCFSGVGEIKSVEFDMRLAVVHIGNNHYSLYGKVVDNDGIEEAVHGNAEIRLDGKIICTIVSSGKIDTEMWESTIRMKLDNISNGRFQSITHIKESGVPEVYERYEKGAITNIPCQ